MCHTSPSETLKFPAIVGAQISSESDLVLTITDTFLPIVLPRIVTGKFGQGERYQIYPLFLTDGTKLDCVLLYRFDINASTLDGEISTTVGHVMEICEFSLKKI